MITIEIGVNDCGKRMTCDTIWVHLIVVGSLSPKKKKMLQYALWKKEYHGHCRKFLMEVARSTHITMEVEKHYRSTIASSSKNNSKKRKN